MCSKQGIQQGVACCLLTCCFCCFLLASSLRGNLADACLLPAAQLAACTPAPIQSPHEFNFVVLNQD